MKIYRLKKDLPTFKAGDVFILNNRGLCLVETDGRPLEYGGKLLAYCTATLEKFPNILTDWFEKIPEEPKSVWDLEEGDKWYFINYSTDDVYISETNSLTCIHSFRKIGNAFLTREEGEKELARRKAKQILLRDTKGFKPNWAECNFGWSVTYEAMDKNPHFETDWAEWVDETIRFATEADAKASIAMHEKEWKIYLGM